MLCDSPSALLVAAGEIEDGGGVAFLRCIFIPAVRTHCEELNSEKMLVAVEKRCRCKLSLTGTLG